MKLGAGRLRHAFTKLQNIEVTFLAKTVSSGGSRSLRAVPGGANTYEPAKSCKGIWSREKRTYTQGVGGEQQSFMDCLHILTSSLLGFEPTAAMRLLRGKYKAGDSWDGTREWIIKTIGPCAKWGGLEVLVIELTKPKEGGASHR